MKLLRVAIGAMLVAVLLACSRRDTSIQEKYFTSEEIERLDQLVTAYKYLICGRVYSRECLYDHLLDIRYFFTHETDSVARFDGRFLDSLLTSVFPTLENVVLSNECRYIDRRFNVTVNHYCLKIDGRYGEFLDELGNTNAAFGKYSMVLRELNDIPPSAAGHFAVYFEPYEFEKEDHLLAFILHRLHYQQQAIARKKLDEVSSQSRDNIKRNM